MPKRNAAKPIVAAASRGVASRLGVECRVCGGLRRSAMTESSGLVRLPLAVYRPSTGHLLCALNPSTNPVLLAGERAARVRGDPLQMDQRGRLAFEAAPPVGCESGRYTWFVTVSRAYPQQAIGTVDNHQGVGRRGRRSRPRGTSGLQCGLIMRRPSAASSNGRDHSGAPRSSVDLPGPRLGVSDLPENFAGRTTIQSVRLFTTVEVAHGHRAGAERPRTGQPERRFTSSCHVSVPRCPCHSVRATCLVPRTCHKQWHAAVSYGLVRSPKGLAESALDLQVCQISLWALRDSNPRPQPCESCSLRRSGR